jgi:MoxR-like ATPase
MSRSPTKAADFLKAMQVGEGAEQPPTSPPVANPPAAVVQIAPNPRPAKAAASKRSELKHFGGYLDDETLEKIALLRVRLKKDNSQLIKLAIDDLYRKHTAKRAFGDA